MAWAGMSRADIEAELLERVELARAEYNSLLAASDEKFEVAGSVLGTPDGTLAFKQSNDLRLSAVRARSAYAKALQELTQFILDGKLPTE